MDPYVLQKNNHRIPSGYIIASSKVFVNYFDVNLCIILSAIASTVASDFASDC